jgi:hypothetical protein
LIGYEHEKDFRDRGSGFLKKRKNIL